MLDLILTQWKTLAKQQLTPVLSSINILVITRSDVSSHVFYGLNLLSAMVLALPPAVSA